MRLSEVPRKELFVALLWEEPLDSAKKLDTVVQLLGTPELLLLPHTLQATRSWLGDERL